MFIPHAMRDTEPPIQPFLPARRLQASVVVGLRAKPEPVKELHHWPYCPCCHQPFFFFPDEPFASCKCGTTEWGNPRPASWVPNPHPVPVPEGVDEWFKVIAPEKPKPATRADLIRRGQEMRAKRAAQILTTADLGKRVWVWRGCPHDGPYGDRTFPYQGVLTAVDGERKRAEVKFGSGSTFRGVPFAVIDVEDPRTHVSWPADYVPPKSQYKPSRKYIDKDFG